MTMMKEQIYDLRHELNKSKISSHGLVTNQLSNMPCVDDYIQNNNLISRKEIS